MFGRNNKYGIVEVYTAKFMDFFKGNILSYHRVKSVRTRSYSGPHFAAFGLNTERHS